MAINWKVILIYCVFIGFVNGCYSCPGPNLFLKRHIEYCFPLNLSSGLENSVIVGNNRNHLTSLRNWLVAVEQRSTSVWKHCWHASVDGWASSTFHSRCDGKGPTVTIIRVGRYIFGGYTSVSWGTLIETFRFEGEDDCEFLESFILPYFTRKVSIVILGEGGYASLPSLALCFQPHSRPFV